MADEMGRNHRDSPAGPAIGRGLRCPGERLPGAVPPDRLLEASGSSFAAAVASGAIALLKSLRPDLSALAIAAAYPRPPERSVIPPLIDGVAWSERVIQFKMR
jgi:subtilisin family serine protease